MQCEAGPSVRGFIDQIFTDPIKIMIIGADCSTSTEPIAELAPFWNLVQVCMGVLSILGIWNGCLWSLRSLLCLAVQCSLVRLLTAHFWEWFHPMQQRQTASSASCSDSTGPGLQFCLSRRIFSHRYEEYYFVQPKNHVVLNWIKNQLWFCCVTLHDWWLSFPVLCFRPSLNFVKIWWLQI